MNAAEQSGMGKAHFDMAVWLLSWAGSPLNFENSIARAFAPPTIGAGTFTANDCHLAALMASNAAPGHYIFYHEADGKFYSQPVMPIFQIPVNRVQNRPNPA